jgi:hypothetical protein
MAIDKKLIDQLLNDYKKLEDIIGENGLLKELTKAILERALAAEMTDLSSSDFRCGPANLWGQVQSRCAMGSGAEPFKFRPPSIKSAPSIKDDATHGEESGGVGAAMALGVYVVPILFDRPPCRNPAPRLIRFPVGPAVLWASAEPVRWVQGELLKFRPLDFGPR